VTAVLVLLVRLPGPVDHSQVVGDPVAKRFDVVDVLPVEHQRREAVAVLLRWVVNCASSVCHRKKDDPEMNVNVLMKCGGNMENAYFHVRRVNLCVLPAAQ
jgi:hypothetical protein